MTEETYLNAKGLKIFLRVFQPKAKPRAIVAIVPGFNAHSGSYLWVAEQMVKEGLAVYALDLQGRGKSEGERFYVEKFADYVDDVKRMVDLAKSREPGLPVFVLGHSAGGVVACMYTLENQAEVRGLICESFAFKVPAPDLALAALKGVSHIAPHAHVLKLNNKDFSRDPKAVAEMDADPLIANESQASLTVAAMVRADERLEKEFPNMKVPVFILHGTADKATKPSGSQFFYDTVGSTDKTLKLYEGHFHDLLADVGKAEVLGEIMRWVDKRI